MVFLWWGATAHQRSTDSSGYVVIIGMGVVEEFHMFLVKLQAVLLKDACQHSKGLDIVKLGKVIKPETRR